MDDSRIFIILIILVIIVEISAKSCGFLAEGNNYLYMVSLQKDEKHICSGVLIGEEHILTAAHCFVKDNGQFKLDKIKAFMGKKDLKDKRRGVISRNVDKVYIPKKYNPQDDRCSVSGLIGDIAVLKLDEFIDLEDDTLEIISLADENLQSSTDYENQFAVLVGYGSYDNKLRYVPVALSGNGVCQWYHEIDFILDNHLCGNVYQRDAQSGEGLCTIDTGSPVIMSDQVIGIFTENLPGCYRRAIPALYTRIEHYADFIEAAVMHRLNDEIKMASLI